ncbi:E3 ubiquitin-protein ligase trul-1-like [Rhynchophorus ferrugineus]|uniref:RING-type domain-containing protein n=1 Tax=Rhynchophorus ferrugineus TaxID=354439 RepID=A0A834I793_RHYFE|nr:hypothetical protein GWI33_013370 [Rhynchophorus ferrugineus]
MNISCTICSDLFVPTADIYTTPCGHIFHYHCLLHWLNKSKTCPQCRAKTTIHSLVRLYINVAASDNIKEDATVLQHRLDGVEFQLRLKDKDISNLTEKKKELKKQNMALRLELKKMEETAITHQSAIAALKDQIKFFKTKSLKCDSLKEEVDHLKNQLKDLHHVQLAITGSRKQIDDIIRNENSIESLALLVATLKKSLVDTDHRKREIQFELKRTQNAYSKYKREMEEHKCKYEEEKRQLALLKLNHEHEVKFLKKKFSDLEARVSQNKLSSSMNNSIRRIVLESPVNCNRTPQPKTSPINIISPSESPRTPEKTEKSTRSATDLPSPIENIGPLGIKMSKVNARNSEDNKFSIFKNKQFSQYDSVVPPLMIDDTAYDGLGGTSKEDVFPTSHGALGVKRPKSNKIPSAKLRKLSANAGKPTKKVSDFF